MDVHLVTGRLCVFEGQWEQKKSIYMHICIIYMLFLVFITNFCQVTRFRQSSETQKTISKTFDILYGDLV